MSDFWTKLDNLLNSLVPASTTTKATTTASSVPKPQAVINPKIPAKWQWITRIEGIPALLAEGLKEYGTLETAGTLNNKRIIAWADEIAKCNPTAYNNWAADWYNKDSVAWCGLFIALLACRSANGKTNRYPVKSYLTALAWANWANAVDWRGKLNNVWCGDLAVFTRSGGGHVAVIIGVSTDGQYLLCLGGNQDDAVNIKLFPISRLYAIRRPAYTIRPKGARHIRISTTGTPISTNEG
jgi:uncharacterized protein (TIGR02594 family)